MNKAIVDILSHNGTTLFNEELEFIFLPRVGETICIQKSLDGTDQFIVTDVTYFLENNIMKPFVQCESFYPQSSGSFPRSHYLQEGGWIKE